MLSLSHRHPFPSTYSHRNTSFCRGPSGASQPGSTVESLSEIPGPPCQARWCSLPGDEPRSSTACDVARQHGPGPGTRRLPCPFRMSSCILFSSGRECLAPRGRKVTPASCCPEEQWLSDDGASEAPRRLVKPRNPTWTKECWVELGHLLRSRIPCCC